MRNFQFVRVMTNQSKSLEEPRKAGSETTQTMAKMATRSSVISDIPPTLTPLFMRREHMTEVFFCLHTESFFGVKNTHISDLTSVFLYE